VYDNQGISEIVETYVDDNSEIKQQRSIKFEGEKSVQLARFIFAHSKDALGVFERKFIGVFIPSYMKGDSIHYKRVEGLYDDRGEEYFDISNITFNKLNKTIKYTEIQKTKKIVSSSGKFNSPYTTYNQDSTKDMFNIYEEPENVEDYMIIKVRDEVVKELDSRYEATRYAWKISLEQAQKRSYVLSVTDGIVKAIYKVIKWEYVTKYNYIYERDIGRVMFTGIEVTDKSICDRFLNKMIPEKYRRKGMASPCLYCKK
jgi:hypothetical protein